MPGWFPGATLAVVAENKLSYKQISSKGKFNI